MPITKESYDRFDSSEEIRIPRAKRCVCNPGGAWLECVDCGGRIHLPECTTKKTSRDCRASLTNPHQEAPRG